MALGRRVRAQQPASIRSVKLDVESHLMLHLALEVIRYLLARIAEAIRSVPAILNLAPAHAVSNASLELSTGRA